MGDSDRENAVTTDRAAIAALVSDLSWQIDQLPRRGIRDSAGNPYNPSYYKRGLKKAIHDGGLAVPDYLRQCISKPASDGYRKLEDADSMDLACESLVADENKPYAHLFTDADRAAARKRLAPYLAAIEARKAASKERIELREADLPADLDALRALAAAEPDAEHAVAINRAILALSADDVIAMTRLGRAYESLGANEDATRTFQDVLVLDPANAIAKRRIREIEHRQAG